MKKYKALFVLSSLLLAGCGGNQMSRVDHGGKILGGPITDLPPVRKAIDGLPPLSMVSLMISSSLVSLS